MINSVTGNHHIIKFIIHMFIHMISSVFIVYDQSSSLNKNEILRLPQSVRDYVSSPYSLHGFEDRLLELIKKLPKETVQLIHERFDPAQTSQDFRFDLLVLADGYSVNLYDSCQFEKEVISNHYELEINFSLTENHFQNSEIEILSSFQIRYLMQLQQNNQNLKINLSKSEFDNIELDSGSNSIKNNPWFTNIIQDGFRFFEINNYDLGSISKVSTDSLVNKEFYKSYQHGHNENLVCVIGESAFNCKAWQNKSMSLEIAISTATILAEKISDEHEQKISLEITRNILDKFSNGMLNYKKELVHQFQLRSMDNILSQVIHKTINNYNKQYPDDQSPIDSSDFMTTLNKYPRLFEIDVLDQLKKEYVNNVKISAPFIKKLDRIQNIVNYFIIFESCLSSHKNIESNKGDLVKLSQSVILDKSLDHDDHISDTSSEDSDDSSDNETQPESLSLEEFFQITFGDEPISYDATNFVVDELTEEIFKVKVIPSLKDPTNGILRNIFPYIIDIINRTISLQRIQDCIRQISDSKELDDSSQTLKRLVDCKGRDYLVAFLDKVPKKALSKILLSLTRANIPIPLLFTNKNDFSQKGLRVLREIHSLILQENYHLLLSFNLTTSELSSPFSKMLYPIICKPREDGLSITSTGSIDISFHPASENYERKPIAIAEVYFEENPHQTFLSLINSFSQFAFYMFLHVNDQDFEGNSPSSELNQLLNTILAGSDNLFISKISVIYWSKSKKNNDPFSKRKKTLKKLLEPHFKSECIKIEQISNDFNQFTEKKKDDFLHELQNSKNDVERTEINRMIEENDISIHDFWLEFIILSELHNNPRKSVLEQLYNVNSKKLQEAFKTWILEGEPLQFLDGLSLRSLPTKFLSCVLGKLMTNVERRLIEVFSTRISNLRQSLLKSALLRKNTSEQFTNVQGFIPYMKTVWEIQEWRQMRVIVNTIKESELPEFITNSKDIINNCVKEIESDYSKWTQIEREFRSELDILNDNWTEKCLKYYSKFVQEQFDADIIEEGKRLIRNMITVERREQDAQWMSLVRKYKDDWLTQCAIKKAGKKIQGLNTTGFKKINEAECAKIFEDIWKEVEDDKKEFNRQMVYQSEKLKQHVQETFNNAVSEFSSTTIDGITSEVRRKSSLHIEYGQTIKWLETICNCLFEFT
uniref:Uncharacterized protein n=1 Tax=Rhizophagus irregularis (strain DAOM 181602 / DAOM 197198 / MUCL 43194) TaxID=747089 RepID=U9TEY0_RHIID